MRPEFLNDFIGPLEAQPRVVGALPNKKPIILNPDGSYSTVYSEVVSHKTLNNGAPSVIPTLIGGKFYDTREALNLILKNKGKDPDTNEAIPGFKSQGDAIAFSIKKSKDHANLLQRLGLLSGN